MPSGPCRFSAPIAPVMMCRSPFSDWVITPNIRSTPWPSGCPGHRRLGGRKVERGAGDADHHPPLEAALAVVGVALGRGDLELSTSPSRQTSSAIVRPVGGDDHPPQVARRPRAARRRPTGSRRRAAARPGSRATAARRRARAAGRRSGASTSIRLAVALDREPHRAGLGHVDGGAEDVLEGLEPALPFTASTTSPGISGCSTPPGSSAISPMVGRSVGDRPAT